jgi:hypothetical protein
MTERVCENCAMPDEELVLVRRVYVTPETWDNPEVEIQEVDETELWCVSCMSQYPHVLADGEDEGD